MMTNVAAGAIARAARCFLGAALVFGCAAGAARAADTSLEMVVFSKPSLGAFLPPIIKAQKLDAANGLDIKFVERPPDAYLTQFNTGEFKLGGSAALLSVGLAADRGVKISYLFNLFDFWGAIVTADPAINRLEDLVGKNMAAARATTNFAMFEWLFHQHGIDPAKVNIINTATPGLIGYAVAGRADAVQLWEPAHSILTSRMKSIRTLNVDFAARWKSFGGTSAIPYLGVAAHEDWIAANRPLVPKLLATYQAAASWALAHPSEAAALIVPKAEEREAVAGLLKDNDRLGLHVALAGELRGDIETVYKAGTSIGYLPKTPPASTIYAGR